MTTHRIFVSAGLLLLSGCATARPGGAPPAAGHREPAAAARAATAAALFARGQALAAQGDSSRAEQYFTLAVRNGYPERRAIVPLVRVCIAASRLRAALDHAEPYLRRHPDAWKLRYLVAAIRLALGRPSEAAEQLQRVIRQHPDSAQAHYLLGVIERDAFRDARAARARFEAYLARAPRGPFAPEVLAWLAEHPEHGRGARARAEVTR